MAAVKNFTGDLVTKVMGSTTYSYKRTMGFMGIGKIKPGTQEFTDMLKHTDHTLELYTKLGRMIQQSLYSEIDTSGRDTEIANEIENFAKSEDPVLSSKLMEVSEKLNEEQELKDLMEEEVNEEVVIPIETYIQLDTKDLHALKKKFAQWKLLYDTRQKSLKYTESKENVTDQKLESARKQFADTEVSYNAAAEELANKCEEILKHKDEVLVPTLLKLLKAKMEYHQSSLEKLMEMEAIMNA